MAHTQRDLSPNTIASYRDTWRQLIKHTTGTRGIAADRIDLAVIDTDLVTSFLEHLTTARHNSTATTCNARLTAIRAVLAQALPDHPEHADTITRVLAIRSRRRPAPTVEFLTTGETEVLLAAPDTSTWTGRRDQALLALAVQTGLRISELITLTCNDIHTATGAHVSCLGKRTPTPRHTPDRHHAHRPHALPGRTRHPPRRRPVPSAPTEPASPATPSNTALPNTSTPPPRPAHHCRTST